MSLGGRLEVRRRGSAPRPAFLQSPRVRTVAITEETAERYAIIRDGLRRAGNPVPANDLWIAAGAMEHALRVVTLDDHFCKMPQIIVDYFDP